MPWKTNVEGCDACEVDQGTNVGQQEIILATPKFIATDYTDVHRWNKKHLFCVFVPLQWNFFCEAKKIPILAKE